MIENRNNELISDKRVSALWRAWKRTCKLLAKQVPGYQLRCDLLKAAGYHIGNRVYIGEDLIIIDELEDRGLLRIGNRVSIAERVTLVLASTPNFSPMSAFVSTAHGPIVIEDDAWLGTGAIVMPNIRIGRGAVVGAAALVTRDVPSFTVVVGVPARTLRKINCPDRMGQVVTETR